MDEPVLPLYWRVSEALKKAAFEEKHWTTADVARYLAVPNNSTLRMALKRLRDAKVLKRNRKRVRNGTLELR